MTVVIFLSALLGSIILGIPVAFALLICGVALMLHLDLFDPQIIAQQIMSGADSFSLMAQFWLVPLRLRPVTIFLRRVPCA